MSETELMDAPGLDVASAVDSIGADLFPSQREELTPEPTDLPPQVEASVPPTGEGDKTEDVPSAAETPVVSARPVPESWPKEMHEHWGKVDPKVQEYWETREKQMMTGLNQYKEHADYGKSLRDVITPYTPIIRAAGMNETQAVQYLLNAHYQLTHPETRQSAYAKLGKDLGIIADDPNATPADPRVSHLEQKLQQVEQSLTARQQSEYAAAQQKASQEVEAFAADKKAHPYFDEVSDHIVTFLKAGDSLQEAYGKAVWANPVTRAKELARVQTETEAKFKENARLEALPKVKAKSVNVSSKDAGRAPTEPLGSMEDTMLSTLKAIKAKGH